MELWLRIGAAMVAVGTVAAVVTLWPLVTGGDPFGVTWYLASMLAPLGLGLILWTFWRQARARGRRHR
jgi:energy-converting hydrogenase Eha subunit E